MLISERKQASRRPYSALAVVLFPLAIIGPLSACAGGSSASLPAPVTLTVSAASDLTSTFQEIGAAFEKETGDRVVFNFGSSGLLAQQIKQGAPVDVFASANVAFVEDLEKSGLIIPGTKAVYATGRAALWSREDSAFFPQTIQDLARPEVRKIAIASPETAPYGTAAKQALQSAGLWDNLQPKLVMGENVRHAFQYARTGNVDVAIVSLSLAMESGSHHWVLVPEDLHHPIDQALAVAKATHHEKEARRFAAFVDGREGRDILRKYGFTVPDGR